MALIDENIFLWINGLSGKVTFFDWLLTGIANDYLIIVSSCLTLLLLWLWGSDIRRREKNQKAVIGAAMSMGLADGSVALINIFYFRPRPFTELPTNLLFYQPTDSSFPSNSAAVLFAIACGVFLSNNKIGCALILLAFLHAFSRVYVGVHYPFDVLAGAAIGLVTALIAKGILKIINRWINVALRLARRIYLA